MDDLGNSNEARYALRTAQVHNYYQQVIERIYKDTAPYMLENTNGVYIMRKDGAKQLIVYVQTSIFAAELNAQRELIKLLMLQLFGEDIDEFIIKVSYGRYKEKHPFESGDKKEEVEPKKQLSTEQLEFIDETADKVEDPHLRELFKKAMKADLKDNN